MELSSKLAVRRIVACRARAQDLVGACNDPARKPDVTVG